MRCPFCRHEDTQVVDSRVSEDGAAIRRRRRCPVCDKRFTTYERSELALPAVVKRDGSRVEFDRRKIAASMKLALRKRPVSADALADALAQIEFQLLATGEREVKSDAVGELVMKALGRLDKVAYVRFASVYRQFEDVSDFQNVIEEFNRNADDAPLAAPVSTEMTAASAITAVSPSPTTATSEPRSTAKPS